MRSPAKTSSVFLLLTLAMAPALVAREADDSRQRQPVITSANRLFMVSGIEAADAAQLALWAEDVASRVEQCLKLTLPVFKSQPIHIAGRVHTQMSDSRVVKAQGYVDGMLTQRLLLVNPSRIEQEEVLEGLCWLLANRYIIRRQSVDERRNHLGEAPDWLSTGLAQNLYPQLRARNARDVLDRWGTSTRRSLDDVMRMEYLPEGRWSNKSFCGLAVGWLLELPAPDRRSAAVFRALAGRERITPAWLAAQETGFENEWQLQQAWQDWVTAQTTHERDWGQLGQEHMDALKGALLIEPAGGATASAMDGHTLGELIPARREPWVQDVAAERRAEMQQLALGRPPEFLQVVRGYEGFLDALTAPTNSALPELELVGLLQKSDRARRALEERLKRQEAFLNEVERKLQAAVHTEPPAEDPAVLASMAAYLDELESRSGQP